MNAYPTFERALQRVEVLKAAGCWPGIVSLADGTYRLTYDPEASQL